MTRPFRWYITIAAVRQWMDLTGRRGDLDDGNPDFVAAEEELRQLCEDAKQASTPPSQSGSLTFRTKTTLRGRRRRVEMDVMPFARTEGSLPQLVRVRLK